MIPYCILVIEDDDDRAFMEQLFVDYHRLMYHEIFKLVHNQWAAEDVMQSTLVRLAVALDGADADEDGIVSAEIFLCLGPGQVG